MFSRPDLLSWIFGVSRSRVIMGGLLYGCSCNLYFDDSDCFVRV